MSPSKPGGPKGRILAHVSADTEVFLIDHAFRLVKRTVGALDELVDPGLYKIKFRRGRVTREEMFALLPGEAEKVVTAPAGLDAADAMLPAAEVNAEPPAPLLGGEHKPAALEPTDASLILFVAAPDDTAAGLSIVDAAGREILDVAATGYRSSGGVAARLALPAGTYRLRHARGALGTLEQSLVLVPEWETRLELAPKTLTTPDGASVTVADLADASVYMTRGPHQLAEARSYARLVRAWLAGPQVTIAASHAQRLITDGIADPLFAACVAHTLVRQSEADRRRGVREDKPRRKLVKTLVSTLQDLVPTHPDVDALSVWLGRSPAASFASPPMLVSSWDVLTAASATRRDLLPANSLSATVAEHLWTSPVWLQWRGDRLEAPAEPGSPQKRETLISQVLAHGIGKEIEATEGLSDLERAVWSCVKQTDLRETHAMFGIKVVERLGVPSATVDRALATLARKLEP